jgi:hypothetical protein
MPAVTNQQLIDAGADCAHIAEMGTSLSPTCFDRLGQEKQTMSAASNAVATTAAGQATTARIAAEAAAITAQNAAVATAGVAALKAAVDLSMAALYQIGSVIGVDFTNSGNYQRVITSISNPDTRYDVAVVSGTLQVDLRQAALLLTGARLQNISRQGGRTYRVHGTFDASGTALATTNGVGLGFDPGTGTGANVVLDATAAAWVWRKDGTLVPYLADGTTYASTYAFTLGTGTVATYVAGDYVTLELTENTNGVGGTLRGFKNGALQFTGTVAQIPAGKLIAVQRGTGGGGAYPSAMRFTFSQVAAIEQVLVPQVTNVVVGASNVLSQAIVHPGYGVAAALSPVRDAQAFAKRVAPAGFSWLPVLPAIVNGAGNVQMQSTLLAALLAAYPLLRSPTVAYVETTGNNGTAVVGNPALPYLTLDAALQSSAYMVVVGNGAYAPPDYRFTQAAAGAMKLIVARNTGMVVVKQLGAALSGLTWTATAGRTGVWQTTIAAAAGLATWEAHAPHHVRLTDTLDADGFPARLRKYACPTLDGAGVTSALNTLEAAGTGWVYDGQTANKVLYVALGGTSVQTNRARIEALYKDANSSNRVYVLGGNLAFAGIYFDGTQIVASEYNNGGTYIPAKVWVSNSWITQTADNCYGAQADSNAYACFDNVRFHACAVDSFNGDSTRGSGADAYGFLMGCTITGTGDIDTFGTAISENRQAISSHAGYLAAFGCEFRGNWGQEIADTASGANPSKSWYVGCIARNGDTRLSSNVGFGFYGANRSAWLDTCAGLAEGTNPLRLEGGAVVKTFNCIFDSTPVFIGPSVAPVAYSPATP